MAAFWAVQVAQQELQADEQASQFPGSQNDQNEDEDGIAGIADGGVHSAPQATMSRRLQTRQTLQSA